MSYHQPKTGVESDNAKCHTPKTAQKPQCQEQSTNDNPHLSLGANPCRREVAYNGNLSERVSILRQRRRDVGVKRFRRVYPTALSYDERGLAYQIHQSLPNFGQTNPTTLQGLMILVHQTVAKLAHRQALHALRQAYRKQRMVSVRQVLETVGWYEMFCVWAYRLYPNAYQYSPIIKFFKQKINQNSQPTE